MLYCFDNQYLYMKNISSYFSSFQKTIFHHWPAIILFAFGLFLVFVRSSGSLNGDEAIYAQTAKETLQHKSWLQMFWREKLWFEKPPFFIWTEMIMFLWFGASEMALRFASGIFGILTAMLAYFAAYDIFKNRISAFVSGFILFSMPIFLQSMRAGMMDTMVTFFIICAIFAVYKSIFHSPRWLYVFATTTGCAIMTKGVVGIIPLIILFFSIIWKWPLFEKNKKQLFQSLVILLAIAMPWHLYMSLAFGFEFWKEYLGYHVIKRFQDNIILSPYTNYIDALINRLGIWILVLPIVFLFTKNIIKSFKRPIIFFLASAVFIVILFSLSKTVVPHYILPAIPLVAIVLGGIIGMLFEKKDRFSIFATAVAMLNFLPHFTLQMSDYGESNVFVPYVANHFITFSEKTCYLAIFISIILFVCIALRFFHTHKKYVISFSLCIFLFSNLAIPFHPDRDPQVKNVGQFVTQLNDPSISHVFISHDEHHRSNTLLFYVPLKITVERTRFANDPLLEKHKSNSLCLILHDEFSNQEMGKSLHNIPDGALYRCEK